ncbi:MAG: NAD-dependent epimerase/dehydratase family protein [Saprospiraceae bacterium]|nr:NAD-dependent epimerase/dehydratase family protein [Candidatus Parvibacillus calidus]
MKVAVTGASGHIGASLCRELLHHGYEVVALIHRDISALKGLPISIVQGDILNTESIKQLLGQCDMAIHAAAAIELAYKFDKNVYDTNVLGTINVLETAQEMGVRRLVHFSSIHAFSQACYDQPLDETRAFVNDNSIFYDQTKRDSHRLALNACEAGLDVVILNPTSAIGPPDQKPSLLGKAVIDLYKGSLPFVVQGGFDFCDVRDIAFGAVKALEKGRKGEAYLLSGHYHSIKELADFVMEAKNSKKRLVELPLYIANIAFPFVKFYSWLTKKPPLFDKTYIDILQDGNKNVSSAKAEAELGFTSRDLRESVEDTVKWFKDNGRL